VKEPVAPAPAAPASEASVKRPAPLFEEEDGDDFDRIMNLFRSKAQKDDF
jgi:hypothetical protein